MEPVRLPTRFVQPDVVVEHFHIRPGDVVADIGSGSGFFLPALAAAVADEGRVYACEIQKSLVEKIGDHVRAANWTQVSPVWGDVEALGGIKVPDGSVDIVVLVNTLFLLADKATAVSEIDRILRPGGKVCVVDWTESFQGMGPQDDMVISQSAATDLFESHSFQLETVYDAGEHHYGLAFRKS